MKDLFKKIFKLNTKPYHSELESFINSKKPQTNFDVEYWSRLFERKYYHNQ